MSLFYKLYKRFKNKKNNKVSLRCYVKNKAQFSMNLRRKRRSGKSDEIGTSLIAPNTKGAMSIEAALTGWIFLSLAISLIAVIELLIVYASIQQSLVNTGQTVCVKDSFAGGSFGIYSAFIQEANQKKAKLTEMDKELSHLSFLGSSIDEESGDVWIKCSYRMKPWLFYLPYSGFRVKHEIHMKLWNGYHMNMGNKEGETSSRIYYVSDYESVYHCTAQCTHLHLSISMVDAKNVINLKNIDGDHYSSCSRCQGNNNTGQVFITDKGDKYHSSLDCSGLKRNIHETSDVSGLKACSRCGGR